MTFAAITALHGVNEWPLLVIAAPALLLVLPFEPSTTQFFVLTFAFGTVLYGGYGALLGATRDRRRRALVFIGIAALHGVCVAMGAAWHL